FQESNKLDRDIPTARRRMYFWLVPLILALALAITVVLWRTWRNFRPHMNAEYARELFKLQRERLEAQFMKAAADTSKPRGLIWKDVQWNNPVKFVKERDTGQIAALVAVTILFEAVAGGDMEGLPAVGNLRNASAVFFFHKGQWATVGKAVF